MLWAIFAVLLILWIVGLIMGTMFGGLLHILLIFALISVGAEILRMVKRRRKVWKEGQSQGDWPATR